MKYTNWLKENISFTSVLYWLQSNFKYDEKRQEEIRNAVNHGLPRPPSYSPEKTFFKKSGICHDASIFTKHSLNAIRKSYDAQILYICIKKDVASHSVCRFTINKNYYIIDYGRKLTEFNGFYGPYKNEQNFVNFFINTLKNYKSIEFYCIGWPDWRKNEENRLEYITFDDNCSSKF